MRFLQRRASEMSEAQQDFRLTTSCCICGEKLGFVELADSKVYDFDGSLDYISLAHSSCVQHHVPLHKWSDWDFEEDS